MLEKFNRINQALIFSKKGFYLYGIISVISVPLTYNSLIRSNNFGVATLLGTVSTILVFFFFRGFMTLHRRYSILTRLSNKIVFLIFLGIVRGMLIFYCGGWLNLQDPLTLAPRLLNSCFTTVIWLGIGTLIVEANRRYDRKYRALLSQLVIANVRSSKELDLGFAKIASELSLLQSNLSKTIKKATSGNSHSSLTTKAAREIREQIDGTLRPLSHRLWSESFYQSPKVKITFLGFHAMKYLKFPVSQLLVLFAGTSGVNYIAAFGIQEGLTRTTAATFALGAGEAIRRLLLTKFEQSAVQINLAYLPIIGLSVNLVATRSVDDIQIKEFLFAYFLLAIFTILQVVVLSTFHLALADRQILLTNIQRFITEKQPDPEMFRDESYGQANVASYLHNSLQSELAAIAISLDKIAIDKDDGALEGALERLHALTQRSMSEDFRNYLEEPKKRLDRIINSWVGIATINLEIQEEVYKDDLRCNLFVQLVQESIANSIRHGNSSKVDVRASYESDTLHVLIEDNGSLDAMPKKGLGHSWIEKFAVHDWSITPSLTGTTVRVEL